MEKPSRCGCSGLYCTHGDLQSSVRTGYTSMEVDVHSTETAPPAISLQRAGVGFNRGLPWQGTTASGKELMIQEGSALLAFPFCNLFFSLFFFFLLFLCLELYTCAHHILVVSKFLTHYFLSSQDISCCPVCSKFNCQCVSFGKIVFQNDSFHLTR